MEITCPKCGNVFEWKPPDDTEVIRFDTIDFTRGREALIKALSETEKKEKRYTVNCTNCNCPISVTI